MPGHSLPREGDCVSSSSAFLPIALTDAAARRLSYRELDDDVDASSANRVLPGPRGCFSAPRRRGVRDPAWPAPRLPAVLAPLSAMLGKTNAFSSINRTNRTLCF